MCDLIFTKEPSTCAPEMCLGVRLADHQQDLLTLATSFECIFMLCNNDSVWWQKKHCLSSAALIWRLEAGWRVERGGEPAPCCCWRTAASSSPAAPATHCQFCHCRHLPPPSPDPSAIVLEVRRMREESNTVECGVCSLCVPLP